MRKLTKKEKNTRIKQLNGWIFTINSRLSRLENIYEYTQKDIKGINIILKEERNSPYYSIPEFIDDFKFEQDKFTNIEAAEIYIKQISDLFFPYRDPETLIHHMPKVKDYYGRYPNLLISRTTFEIEAMIDHSSEISKLKSKLLKHKKNLKNFESQETYTTTQIDKGVKKKEDYQERIKKTTLEIKNKYETLKLHIENLYQNRKSRKRLEEFIRGESEYDTYIIGFEEYTKETIPDTALIPYGKKEKKRRTWIHNNITDIKILKSRIKKYNYEYSEYLIEAGSEGKKQLDNG